MRPEEHSGRFFLETVRHAMGYEQLFKSFDVPDEIPLSFMKTQYQSGIMESPRNPDVGR
jgi:hypothetical protein